MKLRPSAKQLESDIAHLKNNLKKWHALYNEEDLARANRMLAYLEELTTCNEEDLARANRMLAYLEELTTCREQIKQK